MTGDENLEPRFDLACLGEPMLELNLQTSSSPRLYLEAHGGDACNVAVAAARQGLRTALVSAIGVDPAGWSFRELWAREGIDAEAVQVDPEAPTGLYFVSHDTTGHHFSYLRGGSAASRHRLDAAARSVLTRSRMIFASGISLGISEIAAETVFEALSVVRSCGGHGRLRHELPPEAVGQGSGRPRDPPRDGAGRHPVPRPRGCRIAVRAVRP